MSKGTLFLVVTPIGNLSEISKRSLDTLREADVIACEDTRNTRKLLTHFDIHQKLIAYHKFNEEESTKGILALLEEGKNVALVSDAGYPLLSDPGEILVKRVIEEEIPFTVCGGNNAALSALLLSGLDTSHFLFYGFLNAKATAMRKELEGLKEFPYTLIFYEAPHRIAKTLAACKDILGDRKAAVVREISKIHEEALRGRLSDLMEREEWKGEIVLVIEGNHEEKKDDPALLLHKVDDLVRQGMRKKEACGIVAEGTSFSKNQLYALYEKNE